MLEFWRAGGSESSTSPDDARRVEAEGWDGQMFMDSQSLCADPYARMGVWAAATERIKLSTGVTNPLTRHPAVTAAAAASIHAISRGRAVLGVGRGDSALAYLGYAPTGLAAFGHALEQLQTLLRGGEIQFATEQSLVHAPAADTLSLGGRPTVTRLQWLPKDLPKVPLDVAATGPKVIEMSAPIAERVTFSVGANPKRVAWALDLARAARRSRHLEEKAVSFGVQIIVVCHPDVQAMRPIATGMVAPLARFQVIQSGVAGPISADDAENFAAIQRGYDMTKHAMVHSDDKIKGAALSWNFVRRFAIVGSPDHCVERLLELASLGVERFVIVGPGYHPEARDGGGSLFASEVLPAVRLETKRKLERNND